MRERTEQYIPRGLVRSEERKNKMGGSDDIFIGNIKDVKSLVPAIQGIDALIILTSALPKIKPKPGFIPSKGERAENYVREDGSFDEMPECYFEDGGSPEEVCFSKQIFFITLCLLFNDFQSLDQLIIFFFGNVG